MRAVLFVLIIFVISGCTDRADSSKVYVAGAMRNVMIKGDMTPTLNLDTISNKANLYGIGPADQLRGEILIEDGIAYRSFIEVDSSLQMEKTFNLKSPFFVYSNVKSWVEYVLPDSVQTISDIDSFLSYTSRNQPSPFVFRITGEIRSTDFHIVNLPAGTKIQSPTDVNKEQLSVHLENVQVRLIGFYSTNHKGIFTHHDTNVHIHVITSDEKQMGHLDNLSIGSADSMKLYVAK